MGRHVKIVSPTALCLLAIACVLPKSYAEDAASGRKLAFLVGIREYKHLEFKDLDFPENDVEELADILKAHAFKTVILTTARGKKDPSLAPTAENIRNQLRSLLSDVSKHDLIIVGLAGHGIQPIESDESFFCPMDANPVIENGRVAEPQKLIALGELLGQLRRSGIGDKLVLVDACRNDPSVRGRRGVDHVNVSALPTQTGVLLSCSQGEFSFENKSLGKGHGAFFYHVIEGMGGAAKNQEGAVTWDSLRTYVKTQVPSTVQRLFGKEGGEQNPNEIGNLRGAPPVLARIDRPLPRVSTPSEPSPSSSSSSQEKTRPDTKNDPWVKKAQRLHEIGDYDALDKFVKERLREQPDSAIALTYQADVLQNDERIDDAFVAINKAIRVDREIAFAYDVRADLYKAKYDYELALRDYNEAIHLAPESVVYVVDRGWCHHRTKAWSDATADANHALTLDAEYGDAYLLRAAAKAGASGAGSATSQAAEADAREAVRIYERRVSADAEDRAALRNLASAYGWLADHTRAIETYNKLMRKGWGKSTDYKARGTQYALLTRHDWAVADFNKAISRNPRSSVAYSERATSRVALKQWDDAVRDATEAIRLDARNVDAYQTRAVAQNELKQYYDAIRDTTEEIRLDAQFGAAYFTRGTAYFGLQRYEEAIRDYSEALRFDPQNSHIFNDRGAAYSWLNQKDRAIADYEQALRIEPSYAKARENLQKVQQ